MIRPLLILFRDSPDRKRLVLFGLAALVALALGFALVSPAQAATLISAGGYYYILALVMGFLVCARRVGGARREVWRGWLRSPGLPGLTILAASAFAIWCDPFRHKVLFDEYVLQGTALHLHATKEVGTVVRAYEIWGSWQPIDTFLDKRPYFFAFLVSLLHDFTGFRQANAFILNAALVPIALGLVYWLAQALAGRRPALVAVCLLGTLPLLGQQASGAGMELHNLAMLLLVAALAVLYLRAPSRDRLSLLVLGTVLLAQSRYESVVFVAPAALVIVVGWVRAGRVFLSWPAVVAPLLLVPYAWHSRVVSATPLLWQLREGETARFSPAYLPGNLEGAWKFFANTGPSLANSWYLSAVGAIAIGWALAAAWRWARSPGRGPLSAEMLALVAFGAGIVANFVLLLFYYWSRLDELIASRFALPAYVLLALLGALLLARLERWRPQAVGFAALGLAVWLLGWGLPAITRHAYTSSNLVMQEIEWEREQIRDRPGPLLFITNKSQIPFVLWRVPALLINSARQRLDQIAYHFHEGTFREIIVAQGLRATSAEGDIGLDPADALPANFRLEPLAEKLFGTRWMRLSRLVAIDPVPVRTPEPAGVAPGQ